MINVNLLVSICIQIGTLTCFYKNFMLIVVTSDAFDALNVHMYLLASA